MNNEMLTSFLRRVKSVTSKNTILLLASFCILSFSPASAQLKKGEVIVGGGNDDVANSVIQTKDGGYALAGYTASYGVGADNIYVVKMGENLKIQWTKTIGGLADEGNEIVQTKDSGYVIVGNTESFGLGVRNIYVVKLDVSGNLQWTKSIGGSHSDEGYSIIQTKDGGYAITGETRSVADTANGDVYVVKLSASGNIMWTKTIGGRGEDAGNSIVQTLDGGFAIAGETYSFGDTAYGDVYVIKLDSAGNIKWTKTIGGIYRDLAYSIIQTNDAGYAIAGRTESFGAGGDDMYVIKLDAAGNLQWTKTIGGTNIDFAYSIVQAYDKGYAISGGTFSFGPGYGYIYLVKLDSSGNLKWTNIFGDATSDYSYSLVQTADSGYAVAGITNGIGVGTYDIILVKTDSIGNTCQVLVRDSGRVSSGGSITASDSGRISSGGAITSIDSGRVSSGGAIKDSCGVVTLVDNISPESKTIELFPNPNNGKFTLEVKSEELRSKSTIEIYNMLGERIYFQSFNTQHSAFNIDLGSKSPGVYLYRLISETGEQIANGKFIIE